MLFFLRKEELVEKIDKGDSSRIEDFHLVEVAEPLKVLASGENSQFGSGDFNHFSVG